MVYKPQGEGSPFIEGVSTLGNTLGTTGTINKQMIFAGGNNITLSQSINGQSGTITISAGAGGAFAGGVSTLGNTSGSTGLVSSQIVFVGGNNITLSQSTGGVSSATITISGIQHIAKAFALSMDADQTWAQSNGDLRLFPFAMPFYMTATVANVIMNISNSSSAAGTILLNIALYTYTGSTANTLSSTFRSFSYNSTLVGSSYTDLSGTRYRSISLASWAFTPGDYLLVIQNSITTGLTSGTYQFMGKSGLSLNAQEFAGANISNWGLEGNGSFGSSVIPASLHITDINRTGNLARRQIYCGFQGIP